MGSSISQYAGFNQGKESVIWIMGKDNGGKTTFMYKLQTGEIVRTVPTIGFNVETVFFEKRAFLMLDYGGTNKFRPIWSSYFGRSEAIIFVVDSTDIEHFEDAAYELRYLLGQESLRESLKHVPLLIFANKQDKAGARTPADVFDSLKLEDDILKGRKWHVVGCSFREGTGIDEGMHWLVRALDQL